MQDAALCAAIVSTALVLVPGSSAGQTTTSATATEPDSEAVSLVYEDDLPAGCPSQQQFEAEVAKLTSKARFTNARRARRVRIELENSGQGVVGRLLSGDGKNQASREVRGKDCKEVSSALAIAVALTIDPAALGLGPSEPTPTPTPPEPEPEPAKPLPLPVAPPAEPARPPSAAKAEPLELRWGLGAGLMIENAFAPELHLGPHFFGVLAVGQRFRAALGLTRFITREVDDVSFGAWMAEGSVSVNLALLGALRPFASVGYEIGAVDAYGSGLPAAVQAQRPWQAASAGLGLRFETESFFFQLGGCLLVPFTRQRYLISDPLGQIETFYEVPAFGLKQETSLGVFL